MHTLSYWNHVTKDASLVAQTKASLKYKIKRRARKGKRERERERERETEGEIKKR